jgi:hypothetical protein
VIFVVHNFSTSFEQQIVNICQQLSLDFNFHKFAEQKTDHYC